MKIINLWWEGPFTQNQVINNTIDKEHYYNTADKIGLYQIYGFHPLYGNDVLLYIGRTRDKNGFSSRLNNRWEIMSNSNNKTVQIYLGVIEATHKELTEEEINQQIEDAEVLLINALKPAFNSSNIRSVAKKYISKCYTLYNHGNYKKLYPQLTSDYFWNDLINYQIVDKLAQSLSADINDDYAFYGFDYPKNSNIFFGIDYKIWDTKNIPFVVGIYSQSLPKNFMKSKELEYIEHDTEYFYFKIKNEIINTKDIDDIIKKLREQLATIDNFLKL